MNMFVTCNLGKESSTIEGVGIIRLNEICKGYATRDMFIPGKNQSRSVSRFYI